jgi:hypothetical protein
LVSHVASLMISEFELSASFARQTLYHLNHALRPSLCYFLDRVLYFLPRPNLTAGTAWTHPE